MSSPRSLLLRGSCEKAATFTQQLSLTDDANVLSVTTTVLVAAGVDLKSAEDRYSFLPKKHELTNEHTGPLDFVWSQNIKSEAQDVISTGDFKSPVVMLQQGASFVALLPQLSNYKDGTLALDLDVTSDSQPWIAYGAIPSEPHGHSYFRRAVGKTPVLALVAGDSANAGQIQYRYNLMLSSEAPKMGYRRVVRRLWQQSGHPALLASSDAQRNVVRPQLESFASWREEAWHTYADRVYTTVPCAAGSCGTLVSNRNYMGDWSHTEPDAWFNAWFQTLRTAYGWYVYGRARNDAALEGKAESVLNLALSSPQTQGAFPTIYLVKSARWIPSDGWAGYADSYHTFSMSWTAYWMLRWANDLVPQRKQEILHFVQAYGDFLLLRQETSGVIPSWYYAANLKPREEFRDFNAETAPSALLLTELGRATHDKRYTEAAERAMAFIVTEVVPRQRWFDFETYLSCARKPFSFYDEWTAQYPQNNLAEIQAPAAMLALYQTTHNAQYLEEGEQMLDYLLLTQQVWSDQAFSPNLLGGFTTQNTDAEWSDARQGYAATVLFDYYRATGSAEYLERAVAAARSTLAVAPWENWAHQGFGDTHGSLTGFHWGTGSAMTSVELLAPILGDAFVDAKSGVGVGFDACTMTHVSVEKDLIRFDLQATDSGRTYLVRFAGINPNQEYRVQSNGRAQAAMAGSKLLRDGISVRALQMDILH